LKKVVTIMSEPVSSFLRWLHSIIQSLGGMREPVKQAGGPYQVRRNLVAGLARAGYPFRLNPPSFRVTEYVGVLSNVNALRWAIEGKQSGKIRRLVAGPNLVVTPLEEDCILCAPEIDTVVTPCRWVGDWYASLAPELKNKLVEWPVGIDADYWRPNKTGEGKEDLMWLIYDKTKDGGKTELKAVLSELNRRREQYEVIVYGQYTHAYYRNALRKSRAMIMLSPSESQGIAQMEAWACDVPILVWNRNRVEWKDLVFDGPSASSSPYLSEECGMQFSNDRDFAEILDDFIGRKNTFSPREYMLHNFSLTKAALSYSRIFQTLGD